MNNVIRGHHVYKEMWTPVCGKDFETFGGSFGNSGQLCTFSKIAVRIEYALLSEMRLFAEIYGTSTISPPLFWAQSLT